MAISMKESGVGTNTFDFTYGAAGLTQFQRSTRDEFFFSLPIEERKQYPELYKASLEAEQYISEKGYYYFNHEKKEWRITGKYTKPEVFKFSELLTDYIMHSPTLASRFMLSYCRDRLVPRVEAEKVDRSHKDFSRWVWLSYNVGAGYLKRFIAFYKKFPNPRKNADTTQKAVEYLTKLGVKIGDALQSTCSS